jgi:hypothetical protein
MTQLTPSRSLLLALAACVLNPGCASSTTSDPADSDGVSSTTTGSPTTGTSSPSVQPSPSAPSSSGATPSAMTPTGTPSETPDDRSTIDDALTSNSPDQTEPEPSGPIEPSTGESSTSEAQNTSPPESTEAPQNPNPGTCTASEPTGTRASGSGPYEVIVETNSDPGINEGTIFRPAELGGAEKFPIFVWGQGGCSQNGLSNATAMAEIASHGYFVVADGTPNGSGNRTMDRANLEGMGAPLMAYVDWALAENAKPCSAYYQSLDAVKIAANGFSCGGLMAQGTVLDPRIVTWGVTSSGMAGATEEFYEAIHTPVLFVEGGPEEVAYDGALQGYTRISELGVPVMWFDANLGHGGDLFEPDGGDFTKINLAWLNWWLKGDESATGKGLLVGDTCPYCVDDAWDVRSAHLP